MAYVAVKGGEQAIDNAHAWLHDERRGDPATPSLSVTQIESQLGRAVDRVMAEGSLYDRQLSALAIKQSQGDLIEAAFLLRAYRTTLPRFAHANPVDTGAMHIDRRVSAIFKDLPGGQMLGPTPDYTHRLLDFSLLGADQPAATPARTTREPPARMPRVPDILGQEGLLEPDSPESDSPEPDSSKPDSSKPDSSKPDSSKPDSPGRNSPHPGSLHRHCPAEAEPGDLTRQPLSFPAGRDIRLQALARGDEGFLLGLAYSTQRGYGGSHPFAGEIRMGEVAVEIDCPEVGFAIDIGDIVLTECQMVNKFTGSKTVPPQFTRGYGLAFGFNERKAMAMALVDRAMRAGELNEDATAPAQDIEFVLYHSDNIEATGFVEHLKLPHYVDFQSELQNIRRMRQAAGCAS